MDTTKLLNCEAGALLQIPRSPPVFDIYQRRGTRNPLSVFQLLELGANPLQQNEIGESALHFLVKAATEPASETSDDPRMDQVDHLLVYSGHCLVYAMDSSGQTPVHHAAAKNDLRLLKRILNDRKPLPTLQDTQGRLPLVVAIMTNNMACVDALVDAIKQPHELNIQDCHGWTPLHWVVACRRTHAVTLLLDKGSAIPRLTHRGQNLWHVAGSQVENAAAAADGDNAAEGEPSFGDGFCNTLLMLLKHGISPLAMDYDKNLPFFNAAESSAVGLLFPMLRVAAMGGLFEQLDTTAHTKPFLKNRNQTMSALQILVKPAMICRRKFRRNRENARARRIARDDRVVLVS